MSKSTAGNDFFRNFTIAMGVFLIIMWIAPKLLPRMSTNPPDVGATPTGGIEGPRDEQSITATSPQAPEKDAGDTVTQAAEAESPNGFTLLEAETDLEIKLGSAEAVNGDGVFDYRMELTLSNVGASIATALLTDHAAHLHSKERYQLLGPIEQDGGGVLRSLPIEKIVVDGVDVPLLDARWQLGGQHASETGASATFRLTLQKDGVDALRLERVFALNKQSRESKRHDLAVTLRVVDLSPGPSHRVSVTYRGGIGLSQEDTRIDDRVVDWGVRRPGMFVVGNRQQQTKTAKEGTIELFDVKTAEQSGRFSWAATANKYFSCTLSPLAPQSPLDAPVEAENVVYVAAIDADGDATTTNDATLRFSLREATLDAGGTLIYPIDVYLGEKDVDGFRDVPVYQARNYYYQVSQGYGMCTFTFLVELMISLLNAMHAVFADFGVAIIVLVLVVRTMLHPITKKGQVNMVRMQQKMGEFQPKLDELKRKYGQDKARMQQETMKLYREENINPAGQMFTCLPMMLQMPIWFALYISLNNNILMRHEGFLFTWVHDLTAQDALYTFASPLVVPGVGWVLASFNLLPLLLAVTMYTQQKLQPKPRPNPNASEQQRSQQEMMQKMMPMMSIMMLLIFYKMPAGLNLYIMASSLFGTIEQIRIRKHIREHEAAGTLHKPKAPRSDSGSGKPSFLKKLQNMAEDAQKRQFRSNRDKGKPKR